MAQIQRITIEDIVDYFDELEDPRSPINIKHPFVSVVVIAMMGVLAGASGPTAIAKWANLKADFLLQALPLPEGIPCKDVFRSVLYHLIGILLVRFRIHPVGPLGPLPHD